MNNHNNKKTYAQRNDTFSDQEDMEEEQKKEASQALIYQRIFKSQLEYGKFGQYICTPVCYILGHAFLSMRHTPIQTICNASRIDNIMCKCHDIYASSKFALSSTLLMIEEMQVS